MILLARLNSYQYNIRDGVKPDAGPSVSSLPWEAIQTWSQYTEWHEADLSECPFQRLYTVWRCSFGLPESGCLSRLTMSPYTLWGDSREASKTPTSPSGSQEGGHRSRVL